MVRLAQWALNWALRLGGATAGQRALRSAANAVPGRANRTHTQVFNVTPPVTVYVRAGHCRVAVRRGESTKVIVQSNLVRAFGLELAAEQDDAGVYIVARQKPVVGRLSRTEFTLTVPPGCHLVFRLSPGDVVLHDVDGTFELPSDALSAAVEDAPPARPSA